MGDKKKKKVEESTCSGVQSSLVNTLPKTKKGKYTAVTEAHKECT